MCVNLGHAGKVNAKFVAGKLGSAWMATGFVRHGRLGRMTENMVIA